LLVGVLALQGDFLEHVLVLEKLGVETVLVKTKADLEKASALVLPGGESTTFSVLLKKTGLASAIKKRAFSGMPVLASCAGTIVAGTKIVGAASAVPLGLIDITTRRNAFGRQAESFEAELSFRGKRFKAYFIRAPVIEKLGHGVKAVACLEGKPVWVESGKVVAVTFHTELDQNPVVHKRLLEVMEGR
jgi:5'-phosphate synthase pdxT subunit